MDQKTILITGCSSGIGRALAIVLHKRGCRIAATARNIDSISELKKMGMAVYRLDVTDEAQCRSVIKKILATDKKIDILVNNAGYGLMGPVIELTGNDLAAQFGTNVIAPMVLAGLSAKSMKENKSGLIVNIGSVSGITATPFSGAYCASKAALHALSDALRMELTPFNIRVMTVQPGAIQSEFGNTAGKGIAKGLKKESWYLPFKSDIEARATASQKNATPTHEFAARLADGILAKNPRPVVRLGKVSTLMPLMKRFIPTPLLDKLLIRKFGPGR